MPCAASWVWPITFGMLTCCGPVETLTVTVEPGGTFVPAAGSVPITLPGATVLLGCGRELRVSPAWVRTLRPRRPGSCPTTSGTATPGATADLDGHGRAPVDDRARGGVGRQHRAGRLERVLGVGPGDGEADARDRGGGLVDALVRDVGDGRGQGADREDDRAALVGLPAAGRVLAQDGAGRLRARLVLELRDLEARPAAAPRSRRRPSGRRRWGRRRASCRPRCRPG